jgi:hypothetical protein
MIEESMKFARQHPLQSYKVPDRHKFSGEVLDKAYESTEKLVAPILAVGKKYGATIASDGWSDQHRRPILNFMASTRGAAAFLKSVDCTDHMAEGGKKDAAYFACNVISVVNDIWEQGKMVVIWIRGNQAFAAKFGKLTRKSLLLPGTGTLFPSMCIGAAVNVLTSQLSVMPTSSGFLLGIMKMCSRITPALCAAWPVPVRSKPSDP